MDNGAFEEQRLWDGEIALGPVPGWEGGTGVFNPDGNTYTALSHSRPSTGTMSGQNVAYIAAGAAPLTQRTSASVSTGSTYTLVVALGGRDSSNHVFAGAGIDLLVGNATVATMSVNRPPAPGSFGDVTLHWTARENASGLLGVRVRALTSNVGGYVDVGDVRLLKDLDSSISRPTPHEVFQRGSTGLADIPVEASYVGAVELRARLVPRAGLAMSSSPWIRMRAEGDCRFSGIIPEVQPGWYDLQTSVRYPCDTVLPVTVPRIGVGEIFITAGQSNSANSGQSPQIPADERVSTMGPGGHGWQFAQDPQPTANGGPYGGPGGSPWPAFGTRLAQTYNMPVAVISVGWGGTSVRQWLPAGPLYPRLTAAMDALASNGFRAILWHQGEQDATEGTPSHDYVDQLGTLISCSRTYAGRPVPWGIATASHVPDGDAECIARIAAAQAQVVASTPETFPGPDTNGYAADGLTFDGVHFTTAGLTRHGESWAAAVAMSGQIPEGTLPEV